MINYRKIGCDICILVKGYAGSTFKESISGKICNFCNGFREKKFLGEEKFIEEASLSINEATELTHKLFNM